MPIEYRGSQKGYDSRADAKLTSFGSLASHKLQVVEHIDKANIQLEPKDSGKLFTINQGGAGANFKTNLPKLSTGIAGWNAYFVFTASSSSYTWNLITYGGSIDRALSKGDDDEKLYYQENEPGTTSVTNAGGIKYVVSGSEDVTASQISVHTNGENWFINCFNHTGDAVNTIT